MKKLIKVTQRDIDRAIKLKEERKLGWSANSHCVVSIALHKYKIFKNATVGCWSINKTEKRVLNFPSKLRELILDFDHGFYTKLKPTQVILEVE